MKMEGSRVRYLKQWEKQATRPMYEAAFPEDSQQFTDYYYRWKTKDNEIIIMEGAGDDGTFHVMIHLNPYTLCINGNDREIPYIVAVATGIPYRRQGKMRRVMERALQDMEQKKVPFVFLLPADPAYYQGQGFVFFPCQDHIAEGGICFTKESEQGMVRAASVELSNISEERLTDKFDETVEWRHAVTGDAAAMAAFANRVLESRCGIYVRRDIYYYHRLLEELGAEKGGVLVLKTKRTVQGIISYSISRTDGAVTAEIREILLENDISRKEAEQICRNALKEAGCTVDKVKFTSSRMMVRITSLSALVPLLSGRTCIRLSVKVKDTIVNANNGCFRIEIDSGRGRICRVEDTEAEQEMDIAELAGMLFQETLVYLHEWV